MKAPKGFPSTGYKCWKCLIDDTGEIFSFTGTHFLVDGMYYKCPYRHVHEVYNKFNKIE